MQKIPSIKGVVILHISFFLQTDSPQCDLQQQHVAAEVHVQARSQPNRTEDEEESPTEESIYREHGSSSSEEDDNAEQPKVVVTTSTSSRSPPHEGTTKRH